MSGNYRRPRRWHNAPGKRDAATSAEPSPADIAKREAARHASLPRRTAYDVIAAVHSRDAYANLLLPKLLAERGLTGRDAALATELAYGTLRGQGTYDAVLAACSDRPLAKLDPPVLLTLRLGAHQLLNTRVGAHAAVATTVDLAKRVAGQGASGYVNAVLRRVATRDLSTWLDLLAPASTTDEDARLALRHSHPAWIVAAYRDALGSAAELEAALAAGNARPKVTLATFPGGTAREDLMPPGAEPGRWSPYAFTLASGDPGDSVATGELAVQDEGSQLAALALARAPLAPTQTAQGGGELWLDMCAGPGGKARLLAGLAAAGNARLLASELHEHRATLVRDALDRATRSPRVSRESPDTDAHAARQSTYAVITANATRPPWPPNTFDRVLLDAPCSGLGALRRRPEARWRKTPADIPALAELQRALLDSALTAVRPGGLVAYVTCSPVPAETSDVVTAVAAARDDVQILDAPEILADVPNAASPNPLFAQLWPHRHGTDAMFIALLRLVPGR